MVARASGGTMVEKSAVVGQPAQVGASSNRSSFTIERLTCLRIQNHNGARFSPVCLNVVSKESPIPGRQELADLVAMAILRGFRIENKPNRCH